MAKQSRIEWTDATWNPVVGCSRVSEGCEHCYAERMAGRLARMGSEHYQEVVSEDGWTGTAAVAPETVWRAPLGWAKPRVIFVGSMGDIFRDQVPRRELYRILYTAAGLPRHQFVLLTKRADGMRGFFADLEEHKSGLKKMTGERWPLSNVWVGVSVENQRRADERLPYLMDVAEMGWNTWVSIEPLLGQLRLDEVMYADMVIGNVLDGSALNVGGTRGALPPLRTKPLKGVVVGGETGPGARAMHPGWVRGLRDQCALFEVPFFFKQWGEWASTRDMAEKGVVTGHQWASFPWGKCDVQMSRVGKRLAGREVDGVVHDALPWRKDGE